MISMIALQKLTLKDHLRPVMGQLKVSGLLFSAQLYTNVYEIMAANSNFSRMHLVGRSHHDNLTCFLSNSLHSHMFIPYNNSSNNIRISALHPLNTLPTSSLLGACTQHTHRGLVILNHLGPPCSRLHTCRLRTLTFPFQHRS